MKAQNNQNELSIGTKLNNGTYRIESILGQGSFGISYLATAKIKTKGNLGEMLVEAQVAIKEFFMSDVNSRKPDGSTVEGSTGSVFTNYQKKFRKEAENLAKLSHPNIVKVFDVFDENNTTYYVMEFLEGVNLDEYIQSKKHLSEKESISILKEVGDALSYMHSHKMLHLDIKPKNIMRKPDGHYFLIDFGLSKQFTETGEPESSTTIGLGTPGYAPIEQSAYQRGDAFPATLDVYALGATMFKMLTGSRPPEATAVLNEGFPSEDLSELGVSDQLISEVEKAMAPIKKNRYQTVEAFLSGIKRATTEEMGTIYAEPIVIPEPKPEVESQSQPQPQPNPDPKEELKPKPTKNLGIPRPPSQSKKNEKKDKYLWPVLIGILIICCSGLWFLRDDKKPISEPKPNNQQLVASDSTSVTSNISEVKDMKWNSPLGYATYTGQVIKNQKTGESLPHGKGVAKILKGEFTGSVYTGEFDNGKYHGDAEYQLGNGDSFKGTFYNNKYNRGRYTLKSNGEYFEGSFTKGKPYGGKWYSKTGQELK